MNKSCSTWSHNGELTLTKLGHFFQKWVWLLALLTVSIFLVKVQFRGFELFKIKRALFQEEFYLPSLFIPLLTIRWYIFQWMVLLCVYLLQFLLIKPHDTATINDHGVHFYRRSWTNYYWVFSCIAVYHWLNHVCLFFFYQSALVGHTALVLQHCDVIIGTLAIKTCWYCWFFKGDMLTEENSAPNPHVNVIKACQFIVKDLKF